MSRLCKVFLSKVPGWATGVLMTIVFIALYLAGWGPLKSADFKLYNLSSALRPKKLNTPARVVIVGIDKESIEKLGHWPWPGTQIADAINKLNGYGVKVIGLNRIFSEADTNSGLAVIRKLIQKVEADPAAREDKKVMDILNSLLEAELSLDSDAALAKAITDAKNVVLPVMFSLNKAAAVQKGKIPLYLENNSLKAQFNESYRTAYDVTAPIEEFASRASAIGHLNHLTSIDGVVRKEPMLIYYKERLFPSLALQLALKYLGLDIKDAKIGKNLQIREIKIPIDAEVFISYSGKHKSFPYYSFSDLMTGNKLSAAQFKDKIVIIGTVATSINPPVLTPLNTKIPAVEVTANMVENILNNNYMVRPGWFKYPEILLIVLFGLFVSFVIPQMKIAMSSAITALALIATIGAGIFLLSHYGYWLKVSAPAALLVVGYAVMASKHFLLTKPVEDVQTEASVETNKMLGLSFHGQGQLDMAFEKLKDCPAADIAVKEQLYNIGLDFEKKRMFDKAVEVYEHILSAGAYRDLEERIKRLKAPNDTVILNKTRMDATVIMESADKKPTLGRYQLIRELGRGAMGVVYHGKDPVINREVAIKTLRYDEIDWDQIADVKERFLKEAEAAGKLSHPNIVKIYDVGDDNDESFMAMELLSGGDLTRYCQQSARLPFGEVLKIVTGVADALDYAHANGVVHRDIKPANIMLLHNKEIRVTDFGIARVMEKSKTLTGMIMGTPSYMSPEQIAGRKVDGRSDLFSLGVVFYELLSGDKPFKGDSIATLMYNITTSEPIPVNELDRRIPSCIAEIISKMLIKKTEGRYQTGKDFIEDLNQCKKIIIAKQRAKAAAQPPSA
ncbi:serine/threonine-protein kinase [Candidatus Magnetomonas plexicatena]|uniref:serine/threonine-protein kinase n=1 Tax=Candidatus Magnetomonas plexicatena TaxID=2552947 RepID=UPI001C73ED2A|nr:CHASE2 domain-containing protein [Nitrospirales bacterium LBB_01]